MLPNYDWLWSQPLHHLARDNLGKCGKHSISREGLCEWVVDRFRWHQVREQWNVICLFRVAHWSLGNGIIECVYRTIKRMAERSGSPPFEAVFWYNVAPKTGVRRGTIPHLGAQLWVVHPALWPTKQPDSQPATSLREGDRVCVKPPKSCCTSHWGAGLVIKVTSRKNVDVNEVSRHVLTSHERGWLGGTNRWGGRGCGQRNEWGGRTGRGNGKQSTSLLLPYNDRKIIWLVWNCSAKQLVIVLFFDDVHTWGRRGGVNQLTYFYLS